MDISSFKRDSASVEAGQWVSDIPGMGDARLRVRGLNSRTVIALRARKERKATRDERERDGTLKPAAARAVLGEVLHEAVLLEWDGLTDDGKPFPYDPDVARKWLTDPDFEPFADAVVWAAQIVDRGGADDREALAKNSPKPSAGASSGAARPET